MCKLQQKKHLQGGDLEESSKGNVAYTRNDVKLLLLPCLLCCRYLWHFLNSLECNKQMNCNMPKPGKQCGQVFMARLREGVQWKRVRDRGRERLATLQTEGCSSICSTKQGGIREGIKGVDGRQQTLFSAFTD